ncbi:hypothetical protein [Burkholderia alba]|uniref:hypothetical protein n=1 Tax=Burkholderia alba TaxID=2683677 RepID=UPI002B0538A2|nr:hypothetical protein [Burkholderia alba]
MKSPADVPPFAPSPSRAPIRTLHSPWWLTVAAASVAIACLYPFARRAAERNLIDCLSAHAQADRAEAATPASATALRGSERIASCTP